MSIVKYTKDHEYVRVENGVGVVGITDFAQKQLGDIVFVDFSATPSQVTQGDQAAVVESVKAASEVYAPVSGAVIETNPELQDEPELINSDPEGAGWFLKLKVASAAELDALMDADAYAEYVKGL